MNLIWIPVINNDRGRVRYQINPGGPDFDKLNINIDEVFEFVFTWHNRPA